MVLEHVANNYNNGYEKITRTGRRIDDSGMG